MNIHGVILLCALCGLVFFAVLSAVFDCLALNARWVLRPAFRSARDVTVSCAVICALSVPVFFAVAVGRGLI